MISPQEVDKQVGGVVTSKSGQEATCRRLQKKHCYYNLVKRGMGTIFSCKGEGQHCFFLQAPVARNPLKRLYTFFNSLKKK